MVNEFKKIHWTEHSKAKMRQYGLSVSKLLKILRKPERIEEGIVPKTMAVMQTNKKYGNRNLKLNFLKSKWQTKSAPGEVWLMYKDFKDLRKIISAWRYPGISKPGESVPIPEDIREELLNNYAP